MKTFKKLSILLAAVLIIAGCSSKGNDEVISKSEETEIKESLLYVDPEQGSFRVDENGAILKKDEVKSPVTMDSFFDPACGACVAHEEATTSEVDKLMSEGKLTVVYHPVMFLNHDDGSEFTAFSQRVAGFILATAEYAPEKALKVTRHFKSQSLIDAIQNEEYKSLGDVFRATMDEFEYTDEQKELIEERVHIFEAISLAGTEKFADPEGEWAEFAVKDEDGKPMIFTPFVLINKTGEYKASAHLFDGPEDFVNMMKDDVKKALGE